MTCYVLIYHIISTFQWSNLCHEHLLINVSLFLAFIIHATDFLHKEPAEEGKALSAAPIHTLCQGSRLLLVIQCSYDDENLRSQARVVSYSATQ